MGLDEKERRAYRANYQPIDTVERTVTDREEIRKWIMDEKPGSKRRRARY
jgi:hypothetical protein